MLYGHKAMELRHLRYFAAVADAGNVSLAARRLNVTQPALSRQIQDLERDLACRLFDRIGRRIVLTRDGDEILERTRRLLADAEALRESARALAGGEAGVLRLGTTPQFIEAALPEVLTRYARTYPGIEVKLAEDGGGDSSQAGAARRATSCRRATAHRRASEPTAIPKSRAGRHPATASVGKSNRVVGERVGGNSPASAGAGLSDPSAVRRGLSSRAL